MSGGRGESGGGKNYRRDDCFQVSRRLSGRGVGHGRRP